MEPSLTATQARGARAALSSPGAVTVRVRVSREGIVEQAEVVDSTLHALDALVLDHVKRWRFEPQARSLEFLQAFVLRADKR